MSRATKMSRRVLKVKHLNLKAVSELIKFQSFIGPKEMQAMWFAIFNRTIDNISAK